MQTGEMTRRRMSRLLAGTAVSASMRLSAGQQKRSPEIAKAMESVSKSMALANADPNRPAYHFHPPANWMNDPNGTLFYKGWHHLFYQFNPYGAEWGHMHWGHARSKDLVNWEHLPIALAPATEKGEEHVFSGSAIVGADGRPKIFYTSIGKRDPEQWMAESVDDDLITWNRYSGNPVMKLDIHGGRRFADWRDPFVFQEAGKTYMVCGGNWNDRARSGSGVVQLYEATKPDMTAWKHRGPVFEYRDREVINIECPNLFRVGKKWVLLMSAHRPCEYFVGDLNLEIGQFLPETHGVLDPGTAYASNISVDDKGRTLLWLWGKTNTDPAKGWNGCLVLPRMLSIDTAGFLRQQPVPEVEQLRGEPLQTPAAELTEQGVRLGNGDCVEVQITLHAGSARRVGVRIAGSCEVAFDRGSGLLMVGNTQKMMGTEQPMRLRVFLDRSVIEVYANDGEAAIFTTLSGRKNDLIEAFAIGGKGRMEQCIVWPMKSAEFRVDQFA